MSIFSRLVLFGVLALPCVACGGTSPPKTSFEYAIPEFSTKLGAAHFEYVKLGVVGRVSIPKRRDQMKQTLEIGLVNEALRQIQAQAPPGEATALVNVVVLVTEKTQTKEALFTSTKTTRSDLELIVRADIVRFLPATADGNAR